MGLSFGVWLEISDDQQGDYEMSKKEICAMMVLIEFVSLDGLHHRLCRLCTLVDRKIKTKK